MVRFPSTRPGMSAEVICAGSGNSCMIDSYLMDSYFPGDTYTTPQDTKRSFLARIGPNPRWALYVGLLGAVLEARRGALDGVYDDEFWARSSYRVFRLIERCGGRFAIEGFDTLRRLNPPVVFVANHMSTLETQVLPVLIAPILRVTFVVKSQLVKGKLFGPVMRSRDPITVDRVHPGEDLKRVLEGGVERLSNGISVMVFPQSTRTEGFDPDQFNSLGAKLAARSGVAVVPVALKTDFWENGSLIRGFGPIRRQRTIHFAFGDPLSPELGSKTVHRRTVDFIARRLASWS